MSLDTMHARTLPKADAVPLSSHDRLLLGHVFPPIRVRNGFRLNAFMNTLVS